MIHLHLCASQSPSYALVDLVKLSHNVLLFTLLLCLSHYSVVLVLIDVSLSPTLGIRARGSFTLLVAINTYVSATEDFKISENILNRLSKKSVGQKFSDRQLHINIV